MGEMSNSIIRIPPLWYPTCHSHRSTCTSPSAANRWDYVHLRSVSENIVVERSTCNIQCLLIRSLNLLTFCLATVLYCTSSRVIHVSLSSAVYSPQNATTKIYKMLSYRRETALHGAL